MSKKPNLPSIEPFEHGLAGDNTFMEDALQ